MAPYDCQRFQNALATRFPLDQDTDPSSILRYIYEVAQSEINAYDRTKPKMPDEEKSEDEELEGGSDDEPKEKKKKKNKRKSNVEEEDDEKEKKKKKKKKSEKEGEDAETKSERRQRRATRKLEKEEAKAAVEAANPQVKEEVKSEGPKEEEKELTPEEQEEADRIKAEKEEAFRKKLALVAERLKAKQEELAKAKRKASIYCPEDDNEHIEILKDLAVDKTMALKDKTELMDGMGAIFKDKLIATGRLKKTIDPTMHDSKSEGEEDGEPPESNRSSSFGASSFAESIDSGSNTSLLEVVQENKPTPTVLSDSLLT